MFSHYFYPAVNSVNSPIMWPLFYKCEKVEKKIKSYVHTFHNARRVRCCAPYGVLFSIFTFLFLDVIKGVWYIAVGLVAAVKGISVVYQEDELFKI